MIQGLLYCAAYVLLTAPGWAIGRAIFGGRNPAGWIAGAALGYGISALALWLPLFVGRPSRAAFILSWSLAVAAGVLVARRIPGPVLPSAPWTRRDSVALAAILVLIGSLMYPLARVGERDAEGNRLYRAYFIADFVWHTALASEIGKFDMPPRNPYFARERMHYYWTYFLAPSVVAASGPAPLRNVELTLKMNAFMTALVFTAVLFLIARTAVGSGAAAAGGIALAMLAASAEGAYVLIDLYQRGRPLDAVRFLNIDAIPAWHWGGLRIDGLVRALWYNPQHSTATTLGLVACLVGMAGGAAMGTGGIAAAALALGLAVTCNPLIGAMFGLIYTVVIGVDTLRARAWRAATRHWAVPAAAVAAVGWCVANNMLEGAGGALALGLGGLARRRPLATLLLSLGPLLAAALAGALRRGAPMPVRGWAFALGALGLGLALLYLVRLTLDEAWVGFRAGQIIQIAGALLAARLFLPWGSRAARAVAVVVATAVFITGVPTLAIDLYNAQDVTNRSMGPGFHWTIAVTPAEQEAFTWMRRATPVDAVIQPDPAAQGREMWSLIPTFAARRMAAGMAIPLLQKPEHAELLSRVSALFASTDPAAAAAEAQALGIDYLYVGERERTLHPPEALAKFENGFFFAPAFSNAEASVYAVRHR